MPDKREQVALQCEAVAYMAEALAGVHRDYAKLIRAGALDELLGIAGIETARRMKLLGDEAQRLWSVREVSR